DIRDQRADRSANRNAFVVIKVFVFGGDDRVDDRLRNGSQRDREAILHLVVVDGGDELRLDASSAQHDAVVEAFHGTDGRAVEIDHDRQRTKLDVGIFEVLEIDLEIAADE